MDGIGLHMTTEDSREKLQQQIEEYAEHVCRNCIVDSTINALFNAINVELDSVGVPDDIREDVFDYLNSTFHVS
jgi:uncharacterized protein CbrC (UPF0167 family)